MDQQQLIEELEKELEQAHEMIMSLRVSALEKVTNDHEERIRTLTDSVTKFNTLVSLSLGGGLLSGIGLLKVLFS